MGKKKTDRSYITMTEWAQGESGASKGRQQFQQFDEFQALPFDCCAISLLPAENPFATSNGVIFDLGNILQWLKKYKTDPTTGSPLSAKDLFKVNFHRNGEGKIHCPVSYRTFNKFSHIAVIRKSGNVYSYEAIRDFNIRTKDFKDLLSGEEFSREDIIVIQDPNDPDKKKMSEFHHLKHNMSLEGGDGSVRPNETTARFLDTIKQTPSVIPPAPEGIYAAGGARTGAGAEAPRESAAAQAPLSKTRLPASAKTPPTKKPAAGGKLAHYSEGRAAPSFTSTSMPIHTENRSAVIPLPKLRRVFKKGYVTLDTTYGVLNLELHCDIVPLACNNFLQLCERGYYDGTIFHRLIRNFMIQGGDPKGTGRGGESCYGAPFEDEIRPNLLHSGRGVLSMANSGPKTNGSQFFLTFRSASHLDGKHTVFGRLVGGKDNFTVIERIPTDNGDRPVKEVKIVKAKVLVNPWEEAEEEVAEEAPATVDAEQDARGEWFSNPNTAPALEVKRDTTIGKYIDEAEVSAPTLKRKAEDMESD